jgi:hypothetical protein
VLVLEKFFISTKSSFYGKISDFSGFGMPLEVYLITTP